MTFEEIQQRLAGKFGERIGALSPANKDPFLVVQAADIVEICRYAKEDEALAFDCLMNLSTIDWPTRNQIEVVYPLWSYRSKPLEVPTMDMENKEVLRRIEISGDMLLNMGPQHPSTHGVINFLVQTDGEVMKRAIPEVGYLHRSLEKIGERCTYNGYMPYTDRVDYIAAMFANQGWAMAVERLLGMQIPRRAEYCRVIACELNRIPRPL